MCPDKGPTTRLVTLSADRPPAGNPGSEQRTSAPHNGTDPTTGAVPFVATGRDGGQTMPARPLRPCNTPGCPGRTEAGRCAACRGTRQDNPRLRAQTPTERGYTWRWRARRLDYLQEHPVCVLCGRMALIPDHYPSSRKQLVAAGVADPDADEHLRPLCRTCHQQQTGTRQPGGWWRDEMP